MNELLEQEATGSADNPILAFATSERRDLSEYRLPGTGENPFSKPGGKEFIEIDDLQPAFQEKLFSLARNSGGDTIETHASVKDSGRDFYAIKLPEGLSIYVPTLVKYVDGSEEHTLNKIDRIHFKKKSRSPENLKVGEILEYSGSAGPVPIIQKSQPGQGAILVLDKD